MVAISLIALLACVGFALDLGRLYMAKANLQKAAAVAALSTVRQVSGCATGVDEPLSEDDLPAFVNGQLLQNGFLEEQVENLTTLVTPGAQVPEGVGSRLDSDIDPGQADSVSVRITQPLPPAIMPLLPRGEAAEMIAEAHAAQTVVARLSVGSSLLSVNTEESVILNSLLGGMLGTAVNLTVADFGTLIGSNITLLEIVQANPTVATVGDLLDLSTSLPGALNLVSNALQATGDGVELLAEGILRSLAAGASPPSGSIVIGDFIGVEEGLENQVGDLPINALDLLMGLSRLAQRDDSIIELPLAGLVNINLPGLLSTNVSAYVRLGEPAQEAFGRPGYNNEGVPNTMARSSQVEVLLELNLDLLGLAGVNLELGVEAATASAELVRIRCPSRTTPQTQVSVFAETSLARLVVGDIDMDDANPMDTAGPLEIVTLGIPLLANVSIGLDSPLNLPVASSSAARDVDGPFVPDIEEPSPDHTFPVGGDGVTNLGDSIGNLGAQLTAADGLDVTIQVLGLDLGGLVQPIVNAALATLTGLLEPILTAVGTAVLQPLLDGLGVSLAEGEVTIKSATVTQPFLYHTE